MNPRIDSILRDHERSLDKLEQVFLRKTLQIGDVVMAIPPSSLACGSGLYEEAIVVKPWPLLVLASFEGDMRWQSTDNLQLHRIGHVGWWRRRKAMRRVKS